MRNLKWIPVESTNIAAIAAGPIDESGKETVVSVWIKFKTGEAEWEFKKVPVDIWEQFVAAESKGSFFAKNIKGKYESTKHEAA